MTLPALGESVTEGTVSRWLKQVGDTRRGRRAAAGDLHRQGRHRDPLPAAGTMLEIRVQEDETVEVGAVLAVVGDQASGGGADASAPPTSPARTQRRRRPDAQTPDRNGQRRDRGLRADRGRGRGRPGADPGPERRGGRSRRPKQSIPSPSSTARARPPTSATPVASDADAGYVTPLVRKLAKEHGVDLAVGHRHRRRRPDPQAGRAGRGRGGQEGRRGPRSPARGRPPAAPAAAAAPAGEPARCAAPPRRCPGCARPSPSGWSSRCRSRPS